MTIESKDLRGSTFREVDLRDSPLALLRCSIGPGHETGVMSSSTRSVALVDRVAGLSRAGAGQVGSVNSS